MDHYLIERGWIELKGLDSFWWHSNLNRAVRENAFSLASAFQIQQSWDAEARRAHWEACLQGILASTGDQICHAAGDSTQGIGGEFNFLMRAARLVADRAAELWDEVHGIELISETP